MCVADHHEHEGDCSHDARVYERCGHRCEDVVFVLGDGIVQLQHEVFDGCPPVVDQLHQLVEERRAYEVAPWPRGKQCAS